MKRAVLCVLACLLLAAPAPAADKKRPMTIDDLFGFKRVSDPQISPDGKTVVYVVGTVDLDGQQDLRRRCGSPPPTARASRGS